MDHAIQLAKNKRLPIRVIVVDGSRRNDADDESRSHVERRLLDPEPWHVAAYDDGGICRLLLSSSPEKASAGCGFARHCLANPIPGSCEIKLPHVLQVLPGENALGG